MNIDANNTRRFTLVNAEFPVVLAIFDQCRAWTKYAEVGVDAQGRACFVSVPRTYFADEIAEYVW